MRQRISACLQCYMEHCGTGLFLRHWFSVSLLDLLLDLDLRLHQIRWSFRLVNWNAFCEEKMRMISGLVERIMSKFVVHCPVGWVTNCSHLPGAWGVSQDKELLVLKLGLLWGKQAVGHPTCKTLPSLGADLAILYFSFLSFWPLNQFFSFL